MKNNDNGNGKEEIISPEELVISPEELESSNLFSDGIILWNSARDFIAFLFFFIKGTGMLFCFMKELVGKVKVKRIPTNM